MSPRLAGDRLNDQSALRIVADLYAGVRDGAAWHRAILAVVDLVGGSGAMLLVTDRRTRAVLREETFRLDRTRADACRRHWVLKSIRLESLLKVSSARTALEMTPAGGSLRAGQACNELLQIADMSWLLLHWPHGSSDEVTSLCIQGSRSRGPFDANDAAVLEPLIPHLQRALEIRRELERLETRSAMLARSVDLMSFGLIMLDYAGCVLEANAAAQEIMQENTVVRIGTDQTLKLREPAGTQLRDWVSTGRAPAKSEDALLHVPRPDRPPLSVLVDRLPRHHAGRLAGDPCWMVLIFDPERGVPGTTKMIARDLGISVREAEIASLLAMGHTLRQIATRLRISVHTVRCHLKAIYSKTHIRSQPELVGAIMTGPAFVRLAPPAGQSAMKAKTGVRSHARRRLM